MRLYKSLFIFAAIFLTISLNSYSQTFQAYLQYNYKWNGRSFIDDGSSFTSTKFVFAKDQIKIDNSTFTVTNRISNTTGDYVTAVLNEDRSIKISIIIDVQKEANGRKFQCLTIERPSHYKIKYYIK